MTLGQPKLQGRQRDPLTRSQEARQPNSAPYATSAAGLINYTGEGTRDACLVAFLATEHRGRNAGQWCGLLECGSEYAEKQTMHAQHSKSRSYACFCVTKPFPPKGETDAQTPGEKQHSSLCKATPRAPREHMEPACKIPKSHRADCSLGSFATLGCQLLAHGCSPWRACTRPHSRGRKGICLRFPGVPPGEAIKWLLRLLLSCPEY